MVTWLLLNAAAFALAYWADGWHGVGVLLLIEFTALVLLGAAFLYGLAGRQDASEQRIRARMEELLAERDDGADPGKPRRPWRSPR